VPCDNFYDKQPDKAFRDLSGKDWRTKLVIGFCLHRFCARIWCAASGRAQLDASAGLRYCCAMIDPKIFDTIARRVSGAMPPAAKNLQRDLEKNLRAAVQSALSQLDLVTREEFDVQTKVLARSRAKIEELEKQLAALEARLLDKK
jgi:ubiquinone biosynthesis accessory factor UbiK